MTSYTQIALYALAVIVATLIVVSRLKRRLRPPPPPRLPMHPIVDETVWLLQLEPMDWTVHSPDHVEHGAKDIVVVKTFSGPIEITWPEGEEKVYQQGRREGWKELTEAMEAMRVARFRNLVVTEDS